MSPDQLQLLGVAGWLEKGLVWKRKLGAQGKGGVCRWQACPRAEGAGEAIQLVPFSQKSS